MFFSLSAQAVRVSGVSYPFYVGTTSIEANGIFTFRLSAKGTFYVDCGTDGTLSGNYVSGGTIARNNDTATYTYTCTYSSAGTKTIYFGGTATGYPNGDGSSVISFSPEYSLTTDNVKNLNGNLSTIFPYLGSGSGQIPRFAHFIQGSTTLTTISGALFSNYTNVTGATNMFRGAFMNCTALQGVSSGGSFSSIPTSGDLFASITTAEENMFMDTFNGCTSLSQLSHKAGGRISFSGITTGADNLFYRTFFGCTNITSIPSNLFSNITTGAQDMFYQTFCGTGITSIPDNLFSNITTGAKDLFAFTFQSCASLTTIPDNLFSGITTGANGMFYGTFYNCTGLNMLPTSLFSGITTAAERMFQQTFYNCTGLSSYIPPTLFAGLIANGSPTATNMMGATFYNTGSLATSCSGTVIPYTTGYESYWDGHVSCEPGAYITYRCGNGSGTAPASITAAVHSQVTLASNSCNPPTGYGFDGWRVNTESTNRPAGSTFTNNIMGSYAITAQYTGNTYNVTYDCGLGAGTPPASTTAVYGQSFEVAENTCSLPAGYDSFEMWSVGDNIAGLSAGGTTTWSWASDTTLTARYTPATYTATFDCSPGTLAYNQGTSSYSTTFKYNSSSGGFTANTLCRLNGYTATAWAVSGTNTTMNGSSFVYSWPENKTFTAQYTPNSITVNFDNTASMCTYGGTLNIQSPAARPGYVFTGWKLKTGYCGLVTLDSTLVDYGGKNSYSSYNDTKYNLANGQWAVEYDTGILRGEATCNNVGSNTINEVMEAVNNGTMSQPDALAALYGPESDAIHDGNDFTANAATGTNCWCRMIDWTPSGGDQCSVASGQWVFMLASTQFSETEQCAQDCVVYCWSLLSPEFTGYIDAIIGK